MAITRLSALDAAWLLLESPDTPMHVGGLLEFTAPAGAAPDFLREWLGSFGGAGNVQPPFNLVPVRGPLGGRRTPAFRATDDIDLSHHVRLWGLPRPGSQRELGDLVSRLQSHPLDLSKPLWEMHVIDGLQDNGFALFFKLHHALIDGASGMRHIARSMSTDPTERNMPWLWEVGRPPSTHAARASAGSQIGKVWRGLTGLERARREMKAGTIDGLPLRAPYRIPDSPLGARVDGPRRLATQQLELGGLKQLSRAAGGTVNDIVLYLCGTALRHYLEQLAQLPSESLTAGIPVNLRDPGDERPGTSIGFLVAELGTHIADPLERLEAVKRSAGAAKRHLGALPEESLPMQTVTVNAPYIAGLIAGFGARAPIPFNVGISNVPGPREPRYLNGARLEGMYPVSLLTHGNALNITCVSYDNLINFGLVGARDALPHLQDLALGIRAAYDELSALMLPETSVFS